MRRLLVAAVAIAALIAPASLAATSTTTSTDLFLGIEVPPVSSTQGTFAGIALGQLPGTWLAQIVHDPISTTTWVAIKPGGGFSLRTRDGTTVAGAFLGGRITPLLPGTGCTNQTFRIDATMTNGAFSGTLTHYRVMLQSCVTYAASIVGTGTLST